ncbi:low affinity iron permease family protein [Flavobacterium sp. KACC 22761]|uniref:low affinity iron permease family protein n=1 Tax=Flavobacterium sp. KACC 22761 TaxID=3092665 RepID=UPI002A74CDE8|nr:low affinity iron permease family protein [Flavobacterium sp. KACC 22761]WPO78537.1 low affinity iron permease family protein [Flavobacterium sp. KACC 22761]
MKTKTQNKNSAFEKFSSTVSKATGSTPAFIIAFLIVAVWAVSGPFFDYSETWQLVINTGTTIITFLMVFLIQKAQNKDSLAIQLKLNELVASSEFSSNSLVDIESMTEEEMEIVQKYYRRLSELAKKDETIRTSHSIAEAHEQHARKDKSRTQNRTKNSIETRPKNKAVKKPNSTTTSKTAKK